MSADLTRSNGFFPILVLHRDDVAEALRQYDPERFAAGSSDDEPSNETQVFAESLTDEDMEYLAKKLGDDLMNGGDFFEALAARAIDNYWEGS